MQALAHFFKTDSAVGQLRRAAVAEQTALIVASSGSRGSKRPLTELKLEQEAAPALLEPGMYRQEGSGARQQSASSIFATSSAAIGFVSAQRGGGGGACCSNQSKEQPKRKKIRVTSNSSAFPAVAEEQEEDRLAPGTEQSEAKLNDAKKKVSVMYVVRLKKLLEAEELQRFRLTLQQYKVTDQFSVLESMLEDVIVSRREKEPSLLSSFRTFVKNKHLGQFEAFCARFI